jgi:hypothetical protein
VGVRDDGKKFLVGMVMADRNNGELIISDSEHTFSHTPSIFYNIYIYH